MASKTKRTINLVCLEDQPLGGADNMLKTGEIVLTGDLPEDIAPEKLALRVKQGRMGFRAAGDTEDLAETGGTKAPNGFDFADCSVGELKEIAQEHEVTIPRFGKDKIIGALLASGIKPEYEEE